jgi:hypothetical protein
VISSRVRSGVHVPTYIQTYIATYVHTYIHRYIHIYIRVYFVDYICKLIFYTSLITPCLKTWDLVFLAQFFTRCSSYLKPKHDSALDSWRDPRGQLIRLAYSSAGLWRKGKKKLWRKNFDAKVKKTEKQTFLEEAIHTVRVSSLVSYELVSQWCISLSSAVNCTNLYSSSQSIIQSTIQFLKKNFLKAIVCTLT